MQDLISQVNSQLKSKGYHIASSEAKTWLGNQVRKLRLSPEKTSRVRERWRNQSYIGKMYFFFYDPKTRDKLSYYDTFPLVIPFQRTSDGFIGINLHYVEPKIRLKILDKLMAYLTNDKMDETTRIKMSYNFIQTLSTYNFMAPCIKRYLYSSVNSKFLYIEPIEWQFCSLLPFELFQKENKRTVFKESREKF